MQFRETVLVPRRSESVSPISGALNHHQTTCCSRFRVSNRATRTSTAIETHAVLFLVLSLQSESAANGAQPLPFLTSSGSQNAYWMNSPLMDSSLSSMAYYSPVFYQVLDIVVFWFLSLLFDRLMEGRRVIGRVCGGFVCLGWAGVYKSKTRYFYRCHCWIGSSMGYYLTRAGFEIPKSCTRNAQLCNVCV